MVVHIGRYRGINLSDKHVFSGGTGSDEISCEAVFVGVGGAGERYAIVVKDVKRAAAFVASGLEVVRVNGESDVTSHFDRASEVICVVISVHVGC